jgi:hypothetical protein
MYLSPAASGGGDIRQYGEKAMTHITRRRRRRGYQGLYHLYMGKNRY